ncbi:GNAT family N-acetyltransferase [Fenollaria timonensis]|uniref:GNAT family N-acetyltransferase n=1 Tax=Fenollaria timonensis TaxID=1723384 RepID=UPI00071CB6C3|nr:GNAT family N-acetyltransferase [Fenollaria timonensis]
MDYKEIDASHIDLLWELQKQYKAEIGEDIPNDISKKRLKDAISKGEILFFGAWEGDALAGCCSITVGFSTFDYMPSGTFEDFFICPDFRHKGIARQLVQFAYKSSPISSMTVACAQCDIQMYKSLGFSIQLGSLFAFEP